MRRMDELDRDHVGAEVRCATFRELYNWVVDLLNTDELLPAVGIAGREDRCHHEAEHIAGHLPVIPTEEDVRHVAHEAFEGYLPETVLTDVAHKIQTDWCANQQLVPRSRWTKDEATGDVVLWLGPFAQCPCCGYYSIEEWNAYNLCPICRWEDNLVQLSDPTYSGGPNHTFSLHEVRRRVATNGPARTWREPHGRFPRPEEVPPAAPNAPEALHYLPLFPIDEPFKGSGVEPGLRIEAFRWPGAIYSADPENSLYPLTAHKSHWERVGAFVYRPVPVADDREVIPAPGGRGQPILPGWQNHQDIAGLEAVYFVGDAALAIDDLLPLEPLEERDREVLLLRFTAWLEARFTDARLLYVLHTQPRGRHGSVDVSAEFLHEHGFTDSSHRAVVQRALQAQRIQHNT